MAESPDSRRIVHIRIRDLRRQRSLTQEELAEALGLSRQSINAMEAGRCLPSLPVAMQIASFFSVPVHTIFSVDPQNGEITELSPSQASALVQNMTQLNTPWEPLREMREALDELMDDGRTWQSSPAATMPAINMYQDNAELVVEFQVPGFTKDNLAIEVGEDFITVSGQTEQLFEPTRPYIRREFTQQNFSRTVSLPGIVRNDKAEAEIKAGLLIIRVPKIVEERPKTARITIRSHE